MANCAGTPVSTRVSYMAIKKEAEAGAAVTPTTFIPIIEGTIEINKSNLFSTSKLGRRNINGEGVEGPEDTNGEVSTEFSANYSPWCLWGAMGSITSTDISSLTDASVYRHSIVSDNCLESFTIEEGQGRYDDTSNNYQNFIVKRSYGSKFGDLTIAISPEEKVTVSSSVMAQGQFNQARLTGNATAGTSVNLAVDNVDGLTTSDSVNIYDATPQSEQNAIAAIDTAAKTIQIDTLGNSYTVANKAKIELAPQTPSYSPADEQLISGVQVDVRYGADITAAQAATPTCITNFTLNYPNALEGVTCLGKKGMAAQGLVAKGQDITVDFEVSFKNKQYLDNFLNLDSFALYLQARNGVVISATDTNSQQYGFDIFLPKLEIVAHTIASENDGIYTESITAKVLYDASEAYDVKVNVYNGLIGTTYTA